MSDSIGDDQFDILYDWGKGVASDRYLYTDGVGIFTCIGNRWELRLLTKVED